MAMVWLLIVSVVLEKLLLSEAGILTTEQRLLKHVLTDHDKLVRPVLGQFLQYVVLDFYLQSMNQ